MIGLVDYFIIVVREIVKGGKFGFWFFCGSCSIGKGGECVGYMMIIGFVLVV